MYDVINLFHLYLMLMKVLKLQLVNFFIINSLFTKHLAAILVKFTKVKKL